VRAPCARPPGGPRRRRAAACAQRRTHGRGRGMGSTAKRVERKDSWLWDALKNLNEDIVTSSLVPKEWDWNQVHPERGTPLMTLLPDLIRCAREINEDLPAWRLLKYCLGQGADPRKECEAVGQTGGWGDDKTWPKLQTIALVGHSAISLAFAFLTELHKHEKKYEAQIKNANHVLKLIAAHAVPSESSKISIHEAVVDTWESILVNQRCCDVELQVAGGSRASKAPGGAGDGGTLKAHAAVLRAASRVLDATLASPMQEGRTGVVRVEGASIDSVRLCLHLIYTGTTASAELPEPTVLLEALDIAHRWQIGHVVSMLEKQLVRLVSPETLLPIYEAALLKDMGPLRVACKAFAATQTAALRAELEGKLTELQARVEQGPNFPGAKRQRRAL